MIQLKREGQKKIHVAFRQNFVLTEFILLQSSERKFRLPCQPVDRLKGDKKNLLLFLGQQELTKKKEELRFT